jgi:hypothetical protein
VPPLSRRSARPRELYAEEADTLSSEVVRLPVLIAEAWCHPDHGACVGTGGVGDQLAEVTVVGLGQLVLDDQNAVMSEVPTDEVQGGRADAMLGVGQLEVDPEDVGEHVRAASSHGVMS